jgi:hypothetical protein
MRCMDSEGGDIEVTDLWVEGDGDHLLPFDLHGHCYGRGQPCHVTVAEAGKRRKERIDLI